MATGRKNTLSVDLVGRDQLTKPMSDGADAVEKLGKKTKESNEKISASSKQVEAAMSAQLSATKQVELAIRAQESAGDPLLSQLTRLEKEYEETAVKMRAFVRINKEIPEALTKQAADARSAAAALRQQAQAAGQVNERGQILNTTIKASPEKFSKAAGALRVLGGAGGQAGAMFAEGAAKASDLAGIIATGGALGIAIGAVTIAVGLASKAWEFFNKEAEETKRILAAAQANFKISGDEIEEQRKRIDQLTAANNSMGKSSEEVAIAELNAALARKRQNIPAIQEEIDARQRSIQSMKDEIEQIRIQAQARGADRSGLSDRAAALAASIEEESRLVGVQQQGLANSRQRLELGEKEIEQLKRAGELREKNEAQEKRRAERRKQREEERKQAAKDAADFEIQEALRVGRDGTQAFLDMNDAIRESNEEREQNAQAFFEKQKDRINFEHELRLSIIDSQAQKQQELLDEQERVAQESQRMWLSVGLAVADSIGKAFGAAIAAGKSASEAFAQAGKAILSSMLDLIVRLIDAWAVEAAAAAFAANAGVPIAGIGLAIGAAAAARLFVGGLKGALGLAEGGLVPGNDKGKDEVLAMLRPEELVLRPEQSRGLGQALRGSGPAILPEAVANSIRKTIGMRPEFIGGGQAFAAGGLVSGASGGSQSTAATGGSPTFKVEFNTGPMLTTAAELDKMVSETLVPAFDRLIDRSKMGKVGRR